MLSTNMFSYASENYHFFKRSFIRSIELLTGQRKIYDLYKQYVAEYADQDDFFFDSAIRKLSLNINYDKNALADIPKTGPLVIVANHPYGVLDGIVMNHIVHSIRKDFKVLTNTALFKMKEANSTLLPIDFDNTEDAIKTNIDTRKKAREILKQGGCIAVFPAGGVSSIPSWRDKVAQDTEWQPFIGSLIQGSKATVVPLFFEGQNSRLFQVCSLFSLTIRLSLYIKELADRIGSRVGLKIGKPIPYADIAHLKDKTEIVHFLRTKTYELGGMGTLPPPQPAFRIDPKTIKKSK
jgi:putative hemolysin